ncbi:PIN domain protein [Candidatus Desantisbacteria bacterium CG2_30_40_21]|uniref:PIN domain protein n=5 Tax=unclassified Candidatus Desantisiibacteriota TaxID=3106372 RepID=A0A1J5E1M8_9BACT|nr:MAG: PIN domain protein [Candidatus Desantisbacteria bacterium CG2_30_40_21]
MVLSNMKIYLDNCCFNRPFDDQSQIRIRIETEAKLKIQEEIRAGKIQLIWSYILDYENNRNPYIERNVRISGWKKYAIQDIEENPEVLKTANLLNQIGIQKIDSLHISCAVFSKCDYFLTTDDKILQRADQVDYIKINDPIGFIKEVLS